MRDGVSSMKIECLRGVAVRLVLALMLGLLVVAGYVVAPILFAKAGSSHEAGRLAGEIFHVVNNSVIIMAVAVGAFWLRMKSIPMLSWSLLLILASLAGINEYGVSPIIAELKLAAGPIDQLAEGDPLRAKFGMWHGVSAGLHMLAAIASAILVMLDGKRNSCKKS